MNDALGQRMKENFEDRTRYMLPRRTYTIVRVDGKAFHAYSRRNGFKKPFDRDLMGIMDQTAIALCSAMQGAILAYVQSDEISVLLTDFANVHTGAWFHGNVQKITSVSASIATAAFNHYIKNESQEVKDLPVFDARVFTIPDPIEVINYFRWRQQDAVRNSIQAAAQSVYSQKELHGKNTGELQEMLFQKGINWNNYCSVEKRGRAVIKEQYEVPSAYTEKAIRSRWISLDGIYKGETPTFTADEEFLRSRIPLLGFTYDSK